MDYAGSLRYLNSFLNFERITFQPRNRNWNLERMRFLLDAFGYPEKKFFPVLIAGTKGKGSAGFFLESILTASDIAAGFYNSPHLEDPRERIRIGGRMVSKERWARALAHIRSILSVRKLPKDAGDFTYFEVMTLLAMLLFSEERVKVGIFEVGMGGRLDATNVLDAPLSVLTPVELDHEQVLGDTIARIAVEKAAIIKKHADVVTAPQHPEAMKVIRRQCRIMKARLWPPLTLRRARIGLRGDYQKMNAGAAVRAARLLRGAHEFPVTDSGIEEGLQAKHWPGRFEIFKGAPSFLLDGAHNPASIRALVRNLKKFYTPEKCLLIFGTCREKRADRMLDFLGRFFSRAVLTRVSNPRSQEISVLIREARGRIRNVWPVGTVEEALRLARRMSDGDTRVVVTGSFYLVGEARKKIRRFR